MPPTSFQLDRRLLAALLLAAIAYQGLLHGSQLLAVWREGTWFDTDDAMRMVQVRAFLDGQGWFDLVAHRMGLHEPVVMHWSRIVDVPLALMIRAFGLVAAPPLAETLTRLAFPAVLFLLFLLGVMKAARAVAGPAAAMVAFLLAALGSPAAQQFTPGRIDHHAPQIVLLTFAVAALLESLQTGLARRAALAGGLLALSLAISVENMAFILTATGALGLVWVLGGKEAALRLRAYALGLAPTALLLFLATVPPAQRTAEICDAFGAAHLIGILVGGALLLACSAVPVASRAARLALGALAALVVLLALRQTYPACLGDPFVGLPPLLRDAWLNHVGEAMPLARVLTQEPWQGPALVVPPLLTLAGLLWLSALPLSAAERAQALMLAALCAVGLVATIWMIRAASSLFAPVTIGAGIVAARLAGRIPAGPGRLLPVLLPLTLAIPASSTSWSAAGSLVAPEVNTKAAEAGGVTCTRPADLRTLAALPPMRLLSMLDVGPFILAQTHHDVVAGPYHRNIDGNVASLRTFLARPDEAAGIARATGVRNLAFCADPGEMDVLSALAPDGLAASLRDGKVPDWLTKPVIAGPWTVFEIH